MSIFIGYIDEGIRVHSHRKWGRLMVVPDDRVVRMNRRTICTRLVWISDGVSADTLLSTAAASTPYRRDFAMLVAASLMHGSSPRLFVHRGEPDGPITLTDQQFVEIADWTVTRHGPTARTSEPDGKPSSTLGDVLVHASANTLVKITGTGRYNVTDFFNSDRTRGGIVQK
jgi:hypothetical protein